MRLSFTFEFKCMFDSLALWKEIEQYKLNLIDTGEHIFLHGEVCAEELVSIIEICMAYGPVSGDITPARR